MSRLCMQEMMALEWNHNIGMSSFLSWMGSNECQHLPTPSIQHIVNQRQSHRLVGQFERVAYDFCAGARGFDFVDQAGEVVCGLGRAGVYHGGAVGC
jgi:hypothetical protein